MNAVDIDVLQDENVRSIEGFYWSLLIDRSWITRQVNSIKLIDTRIYEKRSTYDINCRELRRRAREYGFSLAGGAILLPIRIGVIDELIDLDVRDKDGGALELASKRESMLIGVSALCGSLGDDYNSLSPTVQSVYRIAFEEALTNPLSKNNPSQVMKTINWLNEGNSEYPEMVYRLTGSRLFVVRLDVGTGATTTLKTREVLPGLTFENGSIALWAMSIDGRTRSNHLCIEAPEGTWISGISLAFEDAIVDPHDERFRDDVHNNGPTYRVQWNYLRSYIIDNNLKNPRTVANLSIGNNGVPSNEEGKRRDYYTVRARLQPKRSYYLGPHLAVFAISSLVYILLLIVSGLTWFNCIGGKGPWVPLNISAIVTLMVVLPTAHAAVLFYIAEHRVLSELHKQWRFTGYSLSAFNILVAALMTVLPLNDSGFYVAALPIFVLAACGALVNIVGECWFWVIFKSLDKKIESTEKGEMVM